MAVTVALEKSTPHMLMYSLTQDGAAGTAATIAGATLIADAVAGPLRELVEAPNQGAVVDQAAARRALMGDGADVEDAHCAVTAILRSGTMTVAVDADVDGVTTTLAELNITCGAAASVAYLMLHFQHSIVR
jgi:hypothetical protein